MPRPKIDKHVHCSGCGQYRPHFAFGMCKSCRNRFYARRARTKRFLESGKMPTKGIFPMCYICGEKPVGTVGLVPYCTNHKKKVQNIVDSHSH